jgi:hypothetical protein
MLHFRLVWSRHAFNSGWSHPAWRRGRVRLVAKDSRRGRSRNLTNNDMTTNNDNDMTSRDNDERLQIWARGWSVYEDRRITGRQITEFWKWEWCCMGTIMMMESRIAEYWLLLEECIFDMWTITSDGIWTTTRMTVYVWLCTFMQFTDVFW